MSRAASLSKSSLGQASGSISQMPPRPASSPSPLSPFWGVGAPSGAAPSSKPGSSAAGSSSCPNASSGMVDTAAAVRNATPNFFIDASSQQRDSEEGTRTLDVMQGNVEQMQTRDWVEQM